MRSLVLVSIAPSQLPAIVVLHQYQYAERPRGGGRGGGCHITIMGICTMHSRMPQLLLAWMLTMAPVTQLVLQH